VPLKVDVIRDRAAIAREVEGGEIENVYRLQIMNPQEVSREVSITVSGLDGIKVEGQTQHVHVNASSSRLVPLRVEAPRAAGRKGSNHIHFRVEATTPTRPQDAPIVVDEKATFVIN